MNISKICTAAGALALLSAAPIAAQTPVDTDSLLLPTIRMSSVYIQQAIIESADRMSAEDYSFRPVPEVRSFGELIGHIIDTNYFFCSTMKGEAAPSSGNEARLSAKADLQKALVESVAYCDPALEAMSGKRAGEIVKFQGQSVPAVAMMNFRNYHAMLHYGNIVTYMRMRGKVPPSTEP
ncbi:MAG: DinB family protein [Gemmatimonadaceae bacterium]